MVQEEPLQALDLFNVGEESFVGLLDDGSVLVLGAEKVVNLTHRKAYRVEMGVLGILESESRIAISGQEASEGAERCAS